MIRSDFQGALTIFNELVASAPTSDDRARVIELASICSVWNRDAMVLVRRADVSASNLEARAQNRRTTDEIAVLYTNAVLWGLGTGLWFDVQTRADSSAGVVLPPLLFAGAAAGGIALADMKDSFGYGVPQSISAGLAIGLQEGLAWSFWNQARVLRDDEWSAKTVATVVWGSATLGGAVGGIVGAKAGATPGRASLVESAALWSGLTFGLTTVALSSRDSTRDDNALLMGAIGVNAGAVGGVIAASSVSPSVARVRFLDLGALSGALVFGGLYVAAAGRDVDARGAAAISAAGIVGGSALAWGLTTRMPEDRPLRQNAPPPATGFSLNSMKAGLIPVNGGMALGLHGRL